MSVRNWFLFPYASALGDGTDLDSRAVATRDLWVPVSPVCCSSGKSALIFSQYRKPVTCSEYKSRLPSCKLRMDFQREQSTLGTDGPDTSGPSSTSSLMAVQLPPRDSGLLFQGMAHNTFKTRKAQPMIWLHIKALIQWDWGVRIMGMSLSLFSGKWWFWREQPSTQPHPPLSLTSSTVGIALTHLGIDCPKLIVSSSPACQSTYFYYKMSSDFTLNSAQTIVDSSSNRAHSINGANSIVASDDCSV